MTSIPRPRCAPCATSPGGSVRARRPARRTTAPPAGWPVSSTRLGYDVARQRVDVPAGESWGVRRPGRTLGQRRRDAARVRPDRAAPRGRRAPRHGAAGARRRGQRLGRRRAARGRRGGRRCAAPACRSCSWRSAPRSRADPTDDDHHYGSRHYVDRLGAAGASGGARDGLPRPGRGGRPGAGRAPPATPTPCSGPAGRGPAGGRRRPSPRAGQRSSDHWSFVRAGLPGARLGSTPYAGYHSAGDVPAVVSPAQLERVGRLVARVAGAALRALSRQAGARAQRRAVGPAKAAAAARGGRRGQPVGADRRPATSADAVTRARARAAPAAAGPSA